MASFVKYPLSVRLENALVAYMRYLGKTVLAGKIRAHVSAPGGLAAQVAGVARPYLLLAITKFAMDLQRQRYLRVGWLWYLGTLVPMIGMVQVGHQSMADRYAYLPLSESSS